jgi:hypothetical protein
VPSGFGEVKPSDLASKVATIRIVKRTPQAGPRPALPKVTAGYSPQMARMTQMGEFIGAIGGHFTGSTVVTINAQRRSPARQSGDQTSASVRNLTIAATPAAPLVSAGD